MNYGSITFLVPHAPSKQKMVQALPSLANNPMHSCPIRPTHDIINFISSLSARTFLISSSLRVPALTYFSLLLFFFATFASTFGAKKLVLLQELVPLCKRPSFYFSSPRWLLLRRGPVEQRSTLERWPCPYRRSSPSQ